MVRGAPGRAERSGRSNEPPTHAAAVMRGEKSKGVWSLGCRKLPKARKNRPGVTGHQEPRWQRGGCGRVVGRGGTGWDAAVKAAFVWAGLQPDSSLLQCSRAEVFPGGLEALLLDSPKSGQRKQEVSCPDRSSGLDPLPQRRRSTKCSSEHLNQPALASASLPSSQQGQRNVVTRARTCVTSLQRLRSTLGSDGVCRAPALPARTLAGKRERCCALFPAAAARGRGTSCNVAVWDPKSLEVSLVHVAASRRCAGQPLQACVCLHIHVSAHTCVCTRVCRSARSHSLWFVCLVCALSRREGNNEKKMTLPGWFPPGFHAQPLPEPGALPGSLAPPRPGPALSGFNNTLVRGMCWKTKSWSLSGFAYPIRGHGAGSQHGKCRRDLFWSHFA